MTPRVRASRARIKTISLTQDQVNTLEKQIADVLLIHIDGFSAYLPARSQMESLARDAYFQGLIDGTQLMDAGAIRARTPEDTPK